jgi:hypothetical protein
MRRLLRKRLRKRSPPRSVLSRQSVDRVEKKEALFASFLFWALGSSLSTLIRRVYLNELRQYSGAAIRIVKFAHSSIFRWWALKCASHRMPIGAMIPPEPFVEVF